MTRKPQVVLALLTWALVGCDRAHRVELHSQDFYSSKFALVLAFDLRDDDHLVAGLCINQALHKPGSVNHIALPFASDLVELDARVAATAGQYREATLLSYVVPEGQSGPIVLAFLPVFRSLPQGSFAIDELPRGVYFARAGLERTFLYKYGSVEEATASMLESFSGINSKMPDAIALALPTEARGLEIRDGRTELPAHLHQTAIARYYPSVSTEASLKGLQVRYEVPPSLGQKRLAEVALKLVAALITPLIGLVLLPKKDTTHPRARRIGIIAMVAVQAGVLLVLVALLIRSPQEVAMQLLTELPVIMGGATSMVAVLWAKK